MVMTSASVHLYRSSFSNPIHSIIAVFQTNPATNAPTFSSSSHSRMTSPLARSSAGSAKNPPEKPDACPPPIIPPSNSPARHAAPYAAAAIVPSDHALAYIIADAVAPIDPSDKPSHVYCAAALRATPVVYANAPESMSLAPAATRNPGSSRNTACEPRRAIPLAAARAPPVPGLVGVSGVLGVFGSSGFASLVAPSGSRAAYVALLESPPPRAESGSPTRNTTNAARPPIAIAAVIHAADEFHAAADVVVVPAADATATSTACRIVPTHAMARIHSQHRATPRRTTSETSSPASS
mmetsp:Transcript_4474/g.18367  ORF Transcript_4474/g.18367 Transcript_4474/m.18367 type:complete len:296 (+) Transcript_4474:140-1027(+)